MLTEIRFALNQKQNTPGPLFSVDAEERSVVNGLIHPGHVTHHSGYYSSKKNLLYYARFRFVNSGFGNKLRHSNLFKLVFGADGFAREELPQRDFGDIPHFQNQAQQNQGQQRPDRTGYAEQRAQLIAQ